MQVLRAEKNFLKKIRSTGKIFNPHQIVELKAGTKDPSAIEMNHQVLLQFYLR